MNLHQKSNELSNPVVVLLQNECHLHHPSEVINCHNAKKLKQTTDIIIMLTRSGSDRSLKLETNKRAMDEPNMTSPASSKSFKLAKLFFSTNKRKQSSGNPEKVDSHILESVSAKAALEEYIEATTSPVAHKSPYYPTTIKQHNNEKSRTVLNKVYYSNTTTSGGTKAIATTTTTDTSNQRTFSISNAIIVDDTFVPPPNQPIKNIEEELSMRVRMASHTCSHLLSKKGQLYVKLIDWKHYSLMNIHVDEFGGITISDPSQQQHFHARIQPTQHFSVNHMGRLPILITKEPIVKKVASGNKNHKHIQSGSPKTITLDGDQREMKLCHVFCFIVVDFETNEMNPEELERNTMECEKINSILFACDETWKDEFKDWNELFELLLLRNMSLINVSSRQLYRPKEDRKRKVLDEMNLVKNAGIEDVIDIDELMNMYEEEIQHGY
jgi:hypothetical protein